MQQLEREDSELSNEEQSKISQLDEEDPSTQESSLLNEQYLLETNTEEEKDPARNGTLRMVLVLVGIGGFLMVAIALWNLFSGKPKEIKLPEIVDSRKTKTNTEETDRLKAELALRGQKSQRQQTKEELQLRKPVYDSSSPEKGDAPTPQRSTSPPVRVSTKTAAMKPVKPKPEPKVNPAQMWTELSNQGLTTTDAVETKEIVANNSDPANDDNLSPLSSLSNNESRQKTSSSPSFIPKNKLDKMPQPSRNSSVPSSTLLKQVTIGHKERFPVTTGKYGILNRTNTTEQVKETIPEKDIPIGTIIKGEIVVPMISALSSGNLQSQSQEAIDTDGLFVIKLDEDLTNGEKSVILPAGTMFVVNAKNISSTNGFVTAEVVAVIYRDRHGENIQQQIEPGAIIALGEELEPLIAEGSFDPGGQIASNDFLLGALSSLGKMGEIMNQPKSSSQVSGAFGSSISTTSDPNLLGAVMQGFFQPIAQSLSSRSEDVIKELQNRETVAVLPVGKQVSLIIKGFVKVVL